MSRPLMMRSRAEPANLARPEVGPPRPGRRLRLALLVGLTAVAVTSALALLGARGDGALALGVAAALAVAAIAYPLAGYGLLLFVAILADQHLSHFSPWTDQLGYYVFNHWWKLLSTGDERQFGFLVANCVDLLLSAVALGLVVQRVRTRTRLFVSPDGALGVLFLLTLCAMLAYGLASGGELKPALWQVRPFLYFVVFALVGTQLLENRRQVEVLIGLFVAASMYKALQINWIFLVEEGGRFGEWRAILGHPDSIFLVAVVVLAVALFLYRAPGLPRALLLGAAPVATAALALNLRRTGYAALALCVLSMPILLHGRRRAALGIVAAGMFVCSLYTAAALSRPEAWWAEPVRKAVTIVAPDPGTTDSSSNLYRVAENYNLSRTIAAHPLGLGFGHPFELHMPIADISFLLPLWRYHPHNMVLGIWSALGSLGFAVFLSYFGAALMLASHNLRRHTDPRTQAVSFFLLASLVSGLLASALDQFIWLDRGALFLGAVVAMVAALHRPLVDTTRPA